MMDLLRPPTFARETYSRLVFQGLMVTGYVVLAKLRNIKRF